MSLDHRRVIGFVALLLGLAAALAAPRQALTGWLAAFVLQSTTVLGGLLFMMLVDVIPGVWRNIVRPPAAMLAAGMPLLAAVCLPVLFGMRLIFPWYGGEGLTGFRAFYLTPLAMAARLIAFFGICIWLQARLSRAPNRPLAVAALIVFVLLDGLFATDVVLSLDPQFHSSGFGLYFLSVQALTAFSAIVLIRFLLSPPDARQRSLLGALFLALLLSWAYFDFMQYFILWSGNLPARADWFLRRSDGVWSVLVLILIILRLGPAFLLLFPPIRQSGRGLLFFAALTLAGSLVEVAWLVIPELESPTWAIVIYLVTSAGMALLTSVSLTQARTQPAGVGRERP